MRPSPISIRPDRAGVLQSATVAEVAFVARLPFNSLRCSKVVKQFGEVSLRDALLSQQAAVLADAFDAADGAGL